MVHPDEDQELSNVNLILYGSIKLSKCGGLYSKAIERWQAKPTQEKKVWANVHQHFITKYECRLAEGGWPALGQDGYGGVYHMADTMEDGSLIIESIVKYGKWATAAETKVSDLEQRLAQLYMDS